VILSIAVVAVIIPYEVLGRYVIGRMAVWANEFAQYALVWASMMGGAVGLKRGYQVGINTLTDHVTLPVGKWVRFDHLPSGADYISAEDAHGKCQFSTKIQDRA
jgi:TRAP-type C4-dicarboxylate transport system permease small subunit